MASADHGLPPFPASCPAYSYLEVCRTASSQPDAQLLKLFSCDFQKIEQALGSINGLIGLFM
jgi:hypothetical protein